MSDPRLDHLLVGGLAATILTQVAATLVMPIPTVFQSFGIILSDVFGPFPPLLGWLWYILLSFNAILFFSTHVSLNLTRIFLIKKVRPLVV